MHVIPCNQLDICVPSSLLSLVHAHHCHSLLVLKTRYLQFHWLSVLWSYCFLPLRKIFLLLPQLCRGTWIFQWAASSPLAQKPTQMFLYHADRETMESFISQDLPIKRAQDHSTLKVHQVHLGTGDVSPLWIWQLRVENGKKYIWLFFRNPPETKSSFQPFSSPYHSPVWIFLIYLVGKGKTWLLFVLYLSNLFLLYLML